MSNIRSFCSRRVDVYFVDVGAEGNGMVWTRDANTETTFTVPTGVRDTNNPVNRTWSVELHAAWHVHLLF